MEEFFGNGFMMPILIFPGVNKLLADGVYLTTTELIKKSVAISVDTHGSSLVAVTGHHDCTGNPTGKETQRNHLLAAMRILDSWGLNARVIGLWVDEAWKATEITDGQNRSST